MDDGRFEDQLPPDLSQIADALSQDRAVADGHLLERVQRRVLARRTRRRRSPRWVIATTLTLIFAVNAGGAIAAAVTGAGFANPVKLAAQGFRSVFRSTSTKFSAAAVVYCTAPNVPPGCTPPPGSSTSVKATVKQKPLRCTKSKVKRTKKVHGKKVTVCVKKKRNVKAIVKRRPPSFTG